MPKLNLHWVTETIGDNYKNWKKGDVVTIQAQTGTGKTFFITGNKDTKGIIDRMDDHETMVYICNRIELKRQIKIGLLKKFNMEVPYLKDEKGNLIIGDQEEPILDNDELDKKTKINNIVVTSYHAISNGKLDNIYSKGTNNLDDFDYIIADECHFFMNDAGYNQKSYLALEELVITQHRKAIKVFISATMDEVKKIIDKQFEKQRTNEFGSETNFRQFDYTTGIDYHYLDIKYFKSIKDITQVIKNDKTNAKWIIFVTSIEKGENMNEELNKSGIPSTFIYAKTSNDEKKRITLKSKFDSKVLISTKCLDNGINIIDSDVKNMVVMTYDKTTFIQELGRIRFKITEAPMINLYIPMFNKKVFYGKIQGNYNPKIADIELFYKDIKEFQKKYNNDVHKVPFDIFYLDSNNNWKVNVLGMARVYWDKDFADEMVSGFNEQDKFTYIKQQLNWIGMGHTFDEGNLIEDTIDNEEKETLELFLESIIGQKLFEPEQQKVSDLIIKELTTISKKVDYRTKLIKPSTLQSMIADQLNLPYVVSKPKTEDRIINGKRVTKKYIIITRKN